MPTKNVDLSDSDYDELVSEAEYDDDIKPSLSTDTNVLLRGSLQRPRHGTLNTKHLHGELPLPQRYEYNLKRLADLIHFGNVDLDAPYQRDVVWSESKMVGLIQSLFLVSRASLLSCHNESPSPSLMTCRTTIYPR